MTKNKALINPKAFIIWGVLLAFFFYQFIARSSFITVLLEDFMKHFNITSTGIGTLGSCYYCVYTIMQIPAGIIIDKYSIKKTATFASFSCALGVLLLVSTKEFYIAGLAQMLLGFGSSFGFLLALKTVINWFPANKVAFFTCVTMSVGCLGPVFGGPSVSMIVKTIDWKTVMFVYSIIGFAISFIIWLTVEEHKKPETTIDKEIISLRKSLKTIISSKQIWILALLTMTMYAPLSALGDMWGIAYIKKAYNADSTTAALINNLLYVGVVFGGPFFGYLVTVMDSYKKPMIIGITTCAISMGFVLFCTNISIYGAAFFFLLTGFSCGAMLGYPLAMMKFSPKIAGTVSGFINMICMFSGVILMPFVGCLIEHSWDGKMENGIKLYDLGDFQIGLIPVIIFLSVGIILSLFVEDMSVNDSSKKA